MPHLKEFIDVKVWQPRTRVVSLQARRLVYVGCGRGAHNGRPVQNSQVGLDKASKPFGESAARTSGTWDREREPFFVVGVKWPAVRDASDRHTNAEQTNKRIVTNDHVYDTDCETTNWQGGNNVMRALTQKRDTRPANTHREGTDIEAVKNAQVFGGTQKRVEKGPVGIIPSTSTTSSSNSLAGILRWGRIRVGRWSIRTPIRIGHSRCNGRRRRPRIRIPKSRSKAIVSTRRGLRRRCVRGGGGLGRDGRGIGRRSRGCGHGGFCGGKFNRKGTARSKTGRDQYGIQTTVRGLHVNGLSGHHTIREGDCMPRKEAREKKQRAKTQKQ